MIPGAFTPDARAPSAEAAQELCGEAQRPRAGERLHRRHAPLLQGSRCIAQGQARGEGEGARAGLRDAEQLQLAQGVRDRLARGVGDVQLERGHTDYEYLASQWRDPWREYEGTKQEDDMAMNVVHACVMYLRIHHRHDE